MKNKTSLNHPTLIQLIDERYKRFHSRGQENQVTGVKNGLLVTVPSFFSYIIVE